MSHSSQLIEPGEGIVEASDLRHFLRITGDGPDL